jgi:flagellar biogenesis protein FliO
MQRTQMVGASEGFQPEGLAAWLLGVLRTLRKRRVTARREMRMVECLSLGGRRQLMLVECSGERYLVGGGADTVETIVHVGGPQTTHGTLLDEEYR